MVQFCLSLLFGAASRIRNLLFDIGLLSQTSLNPFVISIGNLAAGGTGKTPTVVWVGEAFKKMSKTIGVLSRGYGRVSRKMVISDGKKPEDWRVIGDEPALIANRLKCPIGIGPSRSKSGALLVKRYNPDILLLDDAFSHRFIRRNLDVLLLDQDNPWGNGFLPYGTRREPLSSVKRAQVIFVTRNAGPADTSEITHTLEKRGFSGAVFTLHRKALSVVSFSGEKMSLEKAAKVSFFAFSGIADGNRFVETLKNAGISVSGHTSYPDHFRFDQPEIQQIQKNAGSSQIITTEKDFFRTKDLLSSAFYLQIGMVPDSPETLGRFLKTQSSF